MGILDKIFKETSAGNKNPTDIMEKIDTARSDTDLFGMIRSKVEEIRSDASRVAHESIWMQNAAYVIGYSGLRYSPQTRTFIPVNRAGGALKRDRLHVNKILPNLQNRLSRLMKNPPKYDVRPNDMSQDAKDNARFKLNVLNAKWDDLNINARRQSLLMWVQECGHAYLGVFWDDNKGKYVQDPITGEGAFEGDLRVDVIAPFEIFPDPNANNFDDCSYFIRAKIRPLSYFRSRFKNGADVRPEDTWLLSAQFQQRINSFNTKGPSAGDVSDKNTAIELIYMERPTKEHPKGRMIVCANGVILKKGPLPTGDIPLAKFDDIVVAGKYYAESVVTHVRPIQDQYNQVVQRRADWTKKLLAGKYVSPRGNQLIKEALTDEQAEILEYTPVPNAPDGGAPRQLNIPNIPSYAYQEEDRLDGQFAEIMGISEVAKGTLPSASIPALGMQILVEQDDTRIGVMTLQHEAAYARTGQLILDYVQRFYKLPRKLKYAGKQGYIVNEFTGDDLLGENDVIVVTGSTLPSSKALRRQEILNAYGQGLLGDPQDPKVRENVLGEIEFGDVGDLFIDYALTQNRVKREQEFIERGEMPDIDEMDNHPIHIQELGRFRKSDRFYALGEEQVAVFEAVREEHIRMLMEQSGDMSSMTPEDRAQARMSSEIIGEETADLDPNQPMEPNIVEPMESQSTTETIEEPIEGGF